MRRREKRKHTVWAGGDKQGCECTPSVKGREAEQAERHLYVTKWTNSGDVVSDSSDGVASLWCNPKFLVLCKCECLANAG